MGFLNRLFAGDPRRDLERAEAQLEKGEPERALELARRAQERSDGADQKHAAAFITRACEAVAAKALEKAATAVSSKYYEDAMEWVQTALDHVSDPARRGELEERLKALHAKAEDAAEEAEASYDFPPQSEEEVSVTLLDPEVHYQALVGMLVEEVGDLYDQRPAAFRTAYIDLNEGRVTEALAAFEALAATVPADPVLQLELGRCRLMLGDPAAALADFEAVWETFGDDSIDLSGEVSLPGLWAEAKLALGDASSVLERLAPLAQPSADRPTLSYHYAHALLAVDSAETRGFLASAASRFTGQPMFPYLLAGVLARSGDRQEAIECLEMAIAPSCASGNCKTPPKHLPSLRALVALYLEEESGAARVHQLLEFLARDLGGQLTGEDFALLARYHEQTGDERAAERARGEAARLLATAPVVDEVPTLVEATPMLGGQKQPPL